MDAAGRGRPHHQIGFRPFRPGFPIFPHQPLTVMSLTTDFTPRVSWASFVTRAFSASESATPEMLTTAFSVTTFVERALVARWLRREYLTCDVIEASSTSSPAVEVEVPGAGATTTISFLTDLTLSISFA